MYPVLKYKKVKKFNSKYRYVVMPHNQTNLDEIKHHMKFKTPVIGVTGGKELIDKIDTNPGNGTRYIYTHALNENYGLIENLYDDLYRLGFRKGYFLKMKNKKSGLIIEGVITSFRGLKNGGVMLKGVGFGFQVAHKGVIKYDITNSYKIK